MTISRRTFITTSAAAFGAARPLASLTDASSTPAKESASAGRLVSTPGYDPWIEIDTAAFEHNVREIARVTAYRPILGVVKNNAYGLGLATVGSLLSQLDGIAGLAVVKTEEAIALRDAGVQKPILLMGLFDEGDAEELVRRKITLSPFRDRDGGRLGNLGRRLNRPIPVHLYLDTGMSRLGMPYHRALSWIEDLARHSEIQIEGTFMTFTEEDFDHEQLDRFLDLANRARQKKLRLGQLHAASSHGLFFRPDAYLDMVRPGLALYGAYPEAAAKKLADLRPVFRLRARVVRVERLREGDSVSYGRNYIASRPTWIATLPVGHADGYPRDAVNGCEVLIGERTYPVIGAVSASHAIVEVGEQKSVAVGDEATLIGPDHPAVHPNTIADRADISVYDVLMHLETALPKKEWR